MSTYVQKFKIFMASPDDLYEERKIFGEIIEAINRSRGGAEGFHLEPIIWEKYAYPEANNPQSIVNKLLDDAALVIVVFWNKFGAPTKEFPSGTMEEFSKAFEKRKITGKPSIKIYFRQPDPPKALLHIKELQKIFEFKESIKDEALYKNYLDVQAFKDIVQEHINAWISIDMKSAHLSPNKVTNAAKEPVSDMRSLVKDYFIEIEKKYIGLEKPGIYFGISQLDHLLRALEEQNLVLVAGEAATGKTTLLITITNSVASLGKTVLFISPRLRKKEIIDRFICHSGGVAWNRLKSGDLREQDWPPLTMAAGRLSELSIYIDDNCSTSISYIRDVIADVITTHRLGLIIIDGMIYIHHENGKLGQALRVLSRECRVPIIGSLDLSTIMANKRHYGPDRRPILEDLDKFVDFRTEADTVIFTYRNTNTDSTDCYEIIVAKNKDGPIGVVNVRLISQLCKFEESATDE